MLGVEVTIDKFVTEYKDIPHSVFLHLYMIVAQKYKVRKRHTQVHTDMKYT